MKERIELEQAQAVIKRLKGERDELAKRNWDAAYFLHTVRSDHAPHIVLLTDYAASILAGEDS